MAGALLLVPGFAMTLPRIIRATLMQADEIGSCNSNLFPFFGTLSSASVWPTVTP